MTNEIMKSKSNRTPIEIALGIDEDGMTTARKLYAYLELAQGQFSRWAKSNIFDNEFAEENIDYWGFDINVEGNTTQDYRLTAHFAKKLSTKGNGAKAELAREYFTTVEERAKQFAIDRSKLSPHMQMFYSIADGQAKMELEQKRQAKELEDVKKNQKAITQALSRPVDKSFREWVNESLSVIAESESYQYIGSSQDRHCAVRKESYERLNRKRPCRLDQRLDRAKGEAARSGATKTQIKDITKLTIIEGDKDLKPVYEAVIREMLVAYKVNI